MFHDFAQRLASPYQEVRDAATLALMEFYELPDDIVAVEEKNYIAEILRDLNDLGSQAYRHRKSLDKEKYDPFFVKLNLSGSIFKRQFIARAKTTAFTTIGQEDIAECFGLFPEKEEQE